MNKIILHTTPNCSKCKYLKFLLEKENIIFEENTDIDEMINRGFMSAPILEVNGKCLKYNDAIKWAKGSK